MEVEKTVEMNQPETESEIGKKPYQEPKLTEHGRWTEKTGGGVGGSGGG